MNTTSFLIRIVICFLLSLIPLRDLENQIYSARIKLRGHTLAPRPPSNIVIFNLRPEDFKASRHRNQTNSGFFEPVGPEDRLEDLGDLFYWDPEVFKKVLETLLSQEPTSILVTWYIPSEVINSFPSPELEPLAKNKKVIWSSHFDSEGNFVKPARMLRSHSNFAFNNVSLDSDGEVRRASLLKEEQPSLAWAAWAAFQLENLKVTPPPAEPSSYLINYVGPQGTIPSCSLSEECPDLKGKIVLLSKNMGGSLESYGELSGAGSYKTPFGVMNRAEILGNEVHTLVNQHKIMRAPLIGRALLTFATIIGTALYIMYYPLLSATAILATGFVVLGVLFQLVFQLFDFYIPSANIVLSLLITYLVFTGYRLVFQENLQWRALKRAQYLKELDEMKTNFMSLLSHDLKTPLAKIQAVVDRMRRESTAQIKPLAHDWKELFDSLENSNKELQNYITSILSLSKIEAKKVILNKKSNDINQIIERTLIRLRPLANQKSIQFETQLEPLFAVECDEDLIRQVFNNFVDNAIKYSPEGSKIIVRSREEDDFVRVEVEDFGPGIPKDQLPLMFRKFSRFIRPMSAQVKGSGLGLYLSKYFIELHGGSVRVKTIEDQGTIFSFKLPLQRNKS